MGRYRTTETYPRTADSSRGEARGTGWAHCGAGSDHESRCSTESDRVVPLLSSFVSLDRAHLRAAAPRAGSSTALNGTPSGRLLLLDLLVFVAGDFDRYATRLHCLWHFPN